MLAMTKVKVVQAGRDHLILSRISRAFWCLCKPERLEGQRIFVNVLIHMNRTSGSSNMSTLGDERPI